MTVTILILAGSLLLPPQERPAIPDYFGNKGGTGEPRATMACTLTGDEAGGPFKTCRYDCGRTLTVDPRAVCPFVLQP
ncbi:hypothetical protein [Pararhizobium gei]|uniref:hypothetical protein n=1 Tax=Pararhizobium gei TaxID=1395951 RepID=UPI0023DC1A09|nr:hypothetical protein [Rhizobium gei]